MYCSPSEVHITDIHKPTLQNAVFNVHLNSNQINNNNSNGDLNNNMRRLKLDSTNANQQSNSSNNNSDNMDNKEFETNCIFNSTTPTSTTPCTATSEIHPSDIKVSVKYVDWSQPATYPAALHTTDVVIGSDLVYDDKIVNILIPALHSMLKIGMS